MFVWIEPEKITLFWMKTKTTVRNKGNSRESGTRRSLRGVLFRI